MTAKIVENAMAHGAAKRYLDSAAESAKRNRVLMAWLDDGKTHKEQSMPVPPPEGKPVKLSKILKLGVCHATFDYPDTVLHLKDGSELICETEFDRGYDDGEESRSVWVRWIKDGVRHPVVADTKPPRKKATSK